MREHLLVDAYNLFHAARASSHARLFPDLKRLAFLLEHYASDAGSSVTLAVDGTRFADEFVETATLRVLFSHDGQTADAVMEAWMARLAPAERLSWILVSNDVHLCRMGAGMGLRVRSCAAVIEDVARFAGPASARTPRKSSSPPSRKPFNNPFDRLVPAALFAALLLSGAPCRAFEFSGFSRPDSAVCNPATGEVFVSNAEPPVSDVPPEPGTAEADRGGFISKISGNGLVMVQRFIQSGPAGAGNDLKSPKGLAVIQGRLYAADGNYVRVYRADTGTSLPPIPVSADPPAVLGPLAAGRKGEIFAADTENPRIFKINTGSSAAALYVEDMRLKNLSGLAYDAGTHDLLAVTRESGKLFQIDSRGRVETVRKGLGRLSGIFMDAVGGIYLSNSERGEVYRIPDRGKGALTLAAGGLRDAAGIGYDPVSQTILVPMKAEGRLVSAPAVKIRSAVSPKNART